MGWFKLEFQNKEVLHSCVSLGLRLFICIFLFILLFLFYRVTNDVKINNIKVDMIIPRGESYPRIKEYYVAILMDYSYNKYAVCSSSGPGCFVTTYLHDDVIEYETKLYNSFVIDSVWGELQTQIRSSLLLEHMLFALKGKSPKPNLKSKVVRFADPIDHYGDEKYKDNIGASNNRFYFRGSVEKRRKEPARAEFISTSYRKPNFFSFRNIGIVCLNLHLNVDRRSHPEKKGINIDYLGPINIMNVFPEPDKITATGIKYNDLDKMEKIEKEGLFVYAESILYKSLQDTRNYVLVTVLGLVLGYIGKLLLDVRSLLIAEKRKR